MGRRMCDLCYYCLEPGDEGPVCRPCADWERRWNSLTPAERYREEQMMADYAAEMNGQP